MPSRRAVVLASLLGVMGLTSALLLAMRTNPMTPEARTLLAPTDESLDVIFNTEAAANSDPWKYIYIHHSATAAASADGLLRGDGSMGDHFVIGNGDGSGDGELLIDQRWIQQQPARGPRGIKLSPACISICVVGDLDQAAPTPTQYHRLCQLVQTLQAHYHIPTDEVSWLTNLPGDPGGIGRWFPGQLFHEQLLPPQSLRH